MARIRRRDDPWERIATLLPGKVGDRGRHPLFVEAVLWKAHTGSPWRDLPAEFGPRNSLFRRFAR
ncbi:transposase [Niveibacterium sp. COAC-50]|uniref:transposase n=1 Tax=Niveibacterium sp. COAC-50 TaxID=2729384 RepID=UPI0015541A0D